MDRLTLGLPKTKSESYIEGGLEGGLEGWEKRWINIALEAIGGVRYEVALRDRYGDSKVTQTEYCILVIG
jgi:hypothetical protein